MMIKIAVVFSGQARYIEENFSQLKKNLIDALDADVFFHFWKNTLGDTSGKENQGRYDFNWENAEALYQPKKFVLEEHPDIAIFQIVDKYMDQVIGEMIPKDFWGARNAAFRIFSQYCSVNRANLLKKEYENEQGFIYDYVVRVRSDFVFPRPLEFAYLPKEDGQIVILPAGQYPFLNDAQYPGPGIKIPPMESIQDSFAIGNSRDMDLYADAFNTIPYIVEEKKFIGSGETFCGINIFKHGLNLVYSDICGYQSFYTPPMESSMPREPKPYYPTKEEISKINSYMQELYPNLCTGAVISHKN